MSRPYAALTAQIAQLGKEVARLGDQVVELRAELAQRDKFVADMMTDNNLFLVQANEIMRKLRTEIHDAPEQITNQVVIAVGALISGPPAEPATPAAIVLVTRDERPAA